MSGLVTKISSRLSGMTKSQKKVANYLLFNIDKLLFFTVDDLAQAAGVSTATVVRFAREIGFDGYMEMQREARRRFPEKDSEIEAEEESLALSDANSDADSTEQLLKISFQRDIKNLKQTFQTISREDLKKTCQLLKKSKRIFLVGTRVSRSMSTYAYINWGMLRGGVHLVHNDSLEYPEELVGITHDDMLVAFWAPRYNKVTYRMFSYAKSRGAHTVLVTNSGFSAAIEEDSYDILLQCHMKNSSYHSSYVAQVALINYMTRELEREYSNNIAPRLALFDSMLGPGFFFM